MGSTNEAATRMRRESVLDLSSDQKLEYFRSIIARHPRMNRALDDVLTLTAPASGTNLVLLIGPSGVGKSETVATAQKHLLWRYEADLQVDPGCVPVVAMETSNPHFTRNNSSSRQCSHRNALRCRQFTPSPPRASGACGPLPRPPPPSAGNILRACPLAGSLPATPARPALP